jgi:hypothetical protein
MRFMFLFNTEMNSVLLLHVKVVIHNILLFDIKF